MQKLEELLTTQGLAVAVAIASALVILIVGWFAAGRLTRWAVRAMIRARVEQTVATFLGNVTQVLILLAVFIAALSALGVNTTSIVAVLGAAGLAVALALQNSLSNLAAGLLVVSFRLIRVGDVIEVAGANGRVENIGVFHTTLVTADNVRIVVPNSSLSTGVLRNYSAFETRRIDIEFAVGPHDNLERIRSALQEVLCAESRALAEPPWALQVANLTQDKLLLTLQAWVRSADYAAARGDLQHALLKRLGEAGVKTPPANAPQT